MGCSLRGHVSVRHRPGSTFAGLVVAVFVLVTAFSSWPVGAQCEAVVDETESIDVAEVEAAVARLVGSADARVYIFRSVPNGDIDAAVNDLIASCYSDGPNGRQFNLVLIAVSLGDRKTTIQYGGEHNVELGDSEASIQRDVINPHLADGDITEAMVAGLEAIGDELADDPGNAAAAPEPADESPADDAGSTVGLVIALAAVGGSGAAGLGVLVSRRRRLIAARNGLEAASQQPLVAIGVVRERMAQLDARTEVWDRTVLGRTREQLRQLRAAADRSLAAVDGATANYRRATEGGIGSLSRREVEAAEARLDELETALDRAQGDLDQLQQFGDRVERLRVTLPVKSARLVGEIAASLRFADEREAEGWKVADPRAQLLGAERRIAGVDLDDLAIDALAAETIIEEAEATLFAARHDLQTLPDRRAGLLEWAAQLRAGIEAERERASTTRAELASLAAHHAPASIARAGSPDDVDDRLDRCARELELGEQQIGSQAWEAAAANLESAGLWLIRADDLLDHMDTLIVSMETARVEAPGLLEEIAGEIEELASFIRTNDPDLPESFDVEPHQAAAVLQGLVAELRRERPNHLRVAESGSVLARKVDAVLLAAEQERDRVVALRREVQRERDRAWREISRAEKTIGWRLFETSEQRTLDLLRDELGDASASLESQLDIATRVRTRAAQVRADVVAQRRRNSGWIVVGGSGGSGGGGGGGGWGGFSGGGGFGGGGGFSGGGGFGGGGSSSSW